MWLKPYLLLLAASQVAGRLYTPEFTPPPGTDPVDVRLDVVIPKAGETLIWCKSFLLEATEGVHPNNLIAVEPMPGNLSVHHMHLHVCDEGSPSWLKHQEMYSDAEALRPLSCSPPSWERDSGCHGTAW